MIIKFIKNKINKKKVSVPGIFDISLSSDEKKLSKLIKSGNVDHVVDDFTEQLKELFAIRNPNIVYSSNFEKEFALFLKRETKKAPLFFHGRWVYYPWLSKIVHILPEKEFNEVRTARNKNLIRDDEQERFYNAVVGIGGLSIGNSIALALVLKGGCKHIKLADFDRLALSNINRIRTGVNNLGLLKVDMTARQIYEINPYSKVEIFSDGLHKNNLEEFFVGKNKLDVFVDELDNMAIKYLIRKYAKKYKVPVVMAADNGDNAVIDVERYDIDPKLDYFHGRLGDVSYESLSKLNKFEIGKTITKYVGYENISERMQESLFEMGKSLVSWPQLGNTALINGSIIAYIIRRIVNREPVIDNRAIISLDEKLIPDYNSRKEKKKRKKVADYFREVF